MFERLVGYENVKKQLSLVVDMMRDPCKYERIGARMIHGVLLHGAPGTGKTTFARELIDACGVGARVIRKDRPGDGFVDHIREEFAQAMAEAPSIVLLDDLDKFSDDRHLFRSEEMVTVQACMDDAHGTGVLVMATANDIDDFPDSLLRSGRFDMVIEVECPAGDDSRRIVEHYLAERGCGEGLDSEEIARLLDGGSCAQLEAVINEAAMLAAFDVRDRMDENDVFCAAMRVLHDLDTIVAAGNGGRPGEVEVHEAGHAVVAEILEPGSVNFVFADGEGAQRGLTSCRNPESSVSMEQLENKATVLLAGKAACDLVLGIVDPGCRDDLRKAYHLVAGIVDNYCAYGFTNWEGVCQDGNSDALLARKETIVSFEIQKHYMKARKILMNNRDLLDRVSDELAARGAISFRGLREIMEGYGAIRPAAA